MDASTFADLLNAVAAILMVGLFIADEEPGWRSFYALLFVINVAFVII